jgi:hypothetical protein
VETLRHILEHPATKLGLAVLAIVGLTTRADVRSALTDAYEASWPLAALLGLIVVAAAVGWRILRRRNVKVLTSEDEINAALRATVTKADKLLICVGSRSRDHAYLNAIEERLRDKARLRHKRILCGPPAHDVLKAHLLKIQRLHHDDRAIELGVLDMARCEDPEQSLCASENRAVIVVPALGTFGKYDSAIVVTQKRHVEAVVNYCERLWKDARKLKERNDVNALQTTRTRRVEDEGTSA